uniref:Uncharacterized protein n=1 Tax=Anguilla anguilla TaxID=7936 RepID=A0A0E9SZY6_ANGAN
MLIRGQLFHYKMNLRFLP